MHVSDSDRECSDRKIFVSYGLLWFLPFYRNGVDTEEEIYRVTYFGKGRMPVRSSFHLAK